MRLTRILPVAIAVAIFSLAVSPVYGHAFGQRYDLPIPLAYFLIGAAAAVALSFVVIGTFVQKSRESFSYPRLDLLRVPVVGAVLSSRIAAIVVRALSVALFLLLLLTGFFGTNRPIDNLSPTFIWIIWWVGMGYIAALLGNVWMFVNPWKITFEWFQKIGGQSEWDDEAPFRYPEGLDVWPALLLFFLFAWSENVFTGAFRPFTLSIMIVSVLDQSPGWAWPHSESTPGSGTAKPSPFSSVCSLGSRPPRSGSRSKRVCARCDSECSLESECVDCYECYERAERGEQGTEPAPLRGRPCRQAAYLGSYGGLRDTDARDRELRRIPGYGDMGLLAH